MADRPTQLWRSMPTDTRIAAAEAFWRDQESPDIALQHAEATAAIARRLNFRVRSVQTLPVDRRAKHLAQLLDLSDSVITRALIAYHFDAQRPLMAAFLDALQVAHDNGLITADDLPPPAPEALASAIQTVRAAFASDDVDLYLRTLAALDGETWRHLDGLLTGSQV